MSNQHYLQLNDEVTHWMEDTSGENLEYGVIDFYKWAFLEAGAYQTITRSPAVSGVFGGNKYRLSYTPVEGLTSGKVWQGYRSDWVWESGVSFSPPPTSVSVYVNNVLQASGYYVDYPKGRVVFSNAIASGSTVEANFTHRTVSFVPASEPWFRELMFNSQDIEREDFLTNTAGGNWNQQPGIRQQMPVVGVEVIGTRNYKPYQLGGGQWQYKDILYYIYAESKTERDKLRDIIANQNDKVIWLYDRWLMKQSPMWPFTLDYRGSPITGYWTYPSLVQENNGFRYLNARFMNTQAYNQDTGNGWLYSAVVRTTAELINPYG